MLRMSVLSVSFTLILLPSGVDLKMYLATGATMMIRSSGRLGNPEKAGLQMLWYMGGLARGAECGALYTPPPIPIGLRHISCWLITI